MLEFGKMKVEGFGPILDETFDWGKKGLTIISAPNGNGKSKFVNALVWCLYGRVLSGSVVMWDHLQPEDYLGVKVTLNFTKDDVPYKVVRCKNYKGIVEGAKGKNRLLVYEDDIEIEADDKRDMGSELLSILGYGFELFKNTIIFGQKLKRLVNESGPKKKQILDEAFEVMYIAKANKIASDKMKDKGEELNKAENKLTLIENNVTNAENNLETEKQRVENFETDKAKQLSELKGERVGVRKEIRGLKKEKEDLENSISEFDSLRQEITSLKVELDGYKSKPVELAVKTGKLRDLERDALKILKSQQKLEKSLDNVPEKCDNCGKPFTPKEKREEKLRIKKELGLTIKDYQKKIDSISKIKGSIQKLQADVSSAKTIEDSIILKEKEYKRLEKIKNKIPVKEVEIKNKIKERDKLTDKIREVKESSPKNYIEKFTRTLSDLQEEQKDQSKEVKLLRRDYEDLEWLIKDPLSNSGLKAYIFDQMLDNINDRLDYYSKFTGLSIGFTIDMDSTRKDLKTWITNMDNFVTYEELSGGQQQKVDIVIIFAIHDVVSDSKNCSLMVMDELFESLDQSNISILTDLILEKAKDKNLYLITHRTEFNPTNSRIINLESIDGFTRIA